VCSKEFPEEGMKRVDDELVPLVARQLKSGSVGNPCDGCAGEAEKENCLPALEAGFNPRAGLQESKGRLAAARFPCN